MPLEKNKKNIIPLRNHTKKILQNKLRNNWVVVFSSPKTDPSQVSDFWPTLQAESSPSNKTTPGLLVQGNKWSLGFELLKKPQKNKK